MSNWFKWNNSESIKEDDNMPGKEPLQPAPDSNKNNPSTANDLAHEQQELLRIPKKLEKDKITLDLISAVEQMVHQRQLTEENAKDLDDRLAHATNHNERLKKEIKQINGLLLEKDAQIDAFQEQLGSKNIKLDQMVEDYRELQTSLSEEIDELKNTIQFEQNKYTKLAEKYSEESALSRNKVAELEEQIREIESRHMQMKETYDAMRDENKYLVSMVNDFTNRMSTPFIKHAQPKQEEKTEDAEGSKSTQ